MKFVQAGWLVRPPVWYIQASTRYPSVRNFAYKPLSTKPTQVQATKSSINADVVESEKSISALTASDSRSHSVYVPNSFLEHWDEWSPAPSLPRRKFANSFFESHPSSLLFTAGSLHQVTFTNVPEVAFLGRSNVGKSTLLNALLGTKVAHVSAKPGRTRTLNAWAVGGVDRTGEKHRLTVLDMPGYGKGSRAEWGATVQKYLEQRKELKRAFLLVNAVHGLKKSDEEMLQLLRQARIPHQIILSKADGWLTIKGGMIPAKKELKPAKLKNMLSNENTCSEIQKKIDNFVQEIRILSKGDRTQTGLPAVPDILACSSEGSALKGQPPEGRGTLGITALRWAILSSAGLAPSMN